MYIFLGHSVYLIVYDKLLCLGCICCTYYDYTKNITRMNCPKFGTCCYLLCAQVTVLTELFEVFKRAYLNYGFCAFPPPPHFDSFWIRNVSLHGLIQALNSYYVEFEYLLKI